MKRAAKAEIVWSAAGKGPVAPLLPNGMTDEVARQIRALTGKRQELKLLRKVLKKRIEKLKAQQMSRKQAQASLGDPKR